MSIRQAAHRFIRSESGPAATEYAVLVGIIAIGVLLTMAGFGDSMNGVYLAISGAVAHML